jgi:hypothetical protein
MIDGTSARASLSGLAAWVDKLGPVDRPDNARRVAVGMIVATDITGSAASVSVAVTRGVGFGVRVRVGPKVGNGR